MTRSKVLSALALTGLLVGLTVAQAPQPVAPKTGGSGKAADAKQADATAEALRNHPDIRVAEAKLRMAEAELAQAKLLVAQRIAMAQAKVEEYKARAHYAEETHRLLSAVVGATQHEILPLKKEAVAMKAAMVGAEAELAAARGVPLGSDPRGANDLAFQQYIQFLAGQQQHDFAFLAALNAAQSKQVPAGSATEKLRELLDKPVKVGIKRRPFDEALSEFIKQAGLEGITIRAPDWANAATLKNPPMIGPLDGEQTVAGWLQLILDDFNQTLAGVPESHAGKHDIYVREYGLLMTKVDLAPPGALTLNEFVRQLRAAKALEKSEKK